MNLLVPDTGLLLWMLLCFCVVLGVLLRWGFPVILRAIDERRTRIADALEAAREADERLKVVERRVQEMIDHAAHEQGLLLEKGHKEAAALLEEARVQAEQQSHGRLELADRQAEQIRLKALQQAEARIAHLAVQIAQKIIGERLKVEGEQQRLIERMVEREVKNE